MPKYEIILYWSHDDDAYIAEVPELPGCMADGPTAKDALHNVEQIIEEWRETKEMQSQDLPYKNGLDYELCLKVGTLAEEYFRDMLLESEEFRGNMVDLNLQLRDLACYKFAVDIPGDDRSTNHLVGDVVGEFNKDTQTLTVRYDCMDDENEYVVLHEMIHMLEYGLNKCESNVPREMVLFSLYNKLSKRIHNLPDMCATFFTPDVQEAINNRGGTHGLLFFLKSLDIDLQKGWPLCTTLGECYSQYFMTQEDIHPETGKWQVNNPS